MILLRADDIIEWIDRNAYGFEDPWNHDVMEIVFPDVLIKYLKSQKQYTFEVICDAIDEDPILEEAVKAYILTGRYE